MGSKNKTYSVPKKKVERKPYEGHYGTHNDMVIKELDREINHYNEDDSSKVLAVLAEDGDGQYVTSLKWVDSGMTDPYRMYKRISV